MTERVSSNEEARFVNPGVAFREQAKLLRLVDEAATKSLRSIKSMALAHSLTPAFATETYRSAVEQAVIEFGVDPGSAPGRLLLEGLGADTFGSEAYDSASSVLELYFAQFHTNIDGSDLSEALDEALGLSTPTLVAAGENLRRRISSAVRSPSRKAGEWRAKLLERSSQLGMSWRNRVKRDVRTAYTGYHGLLALAYFEARGIRKMRWVTRHDDKVRLTHAAADGQVVDTGLMFVVGGALLPYPGAKTGPADETINCRCVVVSAD
jgi:hypothetical protein